MLIKPYILSIGYKESDEKASCHHLTIKPQTVLNDCISAGHFIYNMSFRSINFIFLYTVLITTATAWLQTTYHHLSFKRIIISLSLSPSSPSLCVYSYLNCFHQTPCNSNPKRLSALALRLSTLSSLSSISIFLP